MPPFRLFVSCRVLSIIAFLLAPSHAVAGGTIDTVLGTGTSAPRPQTGPGIAIKFPIHQPFGVELGPDGALYVTEVGHHRVLRVDLTGENRVTVVAGTGTQGYRGDGGPATEAQLNEPYEVRFDEEGNMYFVEMKNHLVRRVEAKTGEISTIAGTGEPGFGGDGGPAVQARLNHPHSIALDDRGGLYIADIGNHRIRRLDLTTGIIRTIAGNKQRKLPVDGQHAEGNPILGPRALSIDRGVLWIALREGHSVWNMDLAEGVLHHVAGTGEKGFGGDGGPAKKARFNGPKGIAVGPQGNVFVVDTENQVVRKIHTQSATITSIAGQGPEAQGARGDGGPATKAEMDRPHGICVGSEGTLYIGDTLNHRVRRVQK